MPPPRLTSERRCAIVAAVNIIIGLGWIVPVTLCWRTLNRPDVQAILTGTDIADQSSYHQD